MRLNLENIRIFSGYWDGPYRVADWVFLFFIYSILGWIWESIYMSILERKVVNRGFLYGPCIPIYGLGATSMLFFTIPFQHHWWAVALVGMLVGTLLEEVAGRSMEKLFDVKYWTYEGYPGNIDDYICIPATLLWGFFSVFTLYYLNRPFDYLVRSIHYEIIVVIGFAAMVILVSDISISVRNALDFKDAMVKIQSGLEELSRLKKRLDVMIAFYDDKHQYISRLKEGISNGMEWMPDVLESVKLRLNIMDELRISHKEKLDEEKEKELYSIKEKFIEQEVYSDQYFGRLKKYIRHLLNTNPKASIKKIGGKLKNLKDKVTDKLPSK